MHAFIGCPIFPHYVVYNYNEINKQYILGFCRDFFFHFFSSLFQASQLCLDDKLIILIRGMARAIGSSPMLGKNGKMQAKWSLKGGSNLSMYTSVGECRSIVKENMDLTAALQKNGKMKRRTIITFHLVNMIGWAII